MYSITTPDFSPSGYSLGGMAGRPKWGKILPMEVFINGEPRGLDQGLRLDGLIRELELQDQRLAVEINREIVPRSKFADTVISDGDVIEIVHAIGGG